MSYVSHLLLFKCQGFPRPVYAIDLSALMLDSKLRVVYTECDADADVRQLIRSSAGEWWRRWQS